MRSLDIVLEIGGISLDEITKAALAKKKNDWFVDYVNSMKPEEIFSGVKELLVKLRKRGLKVGLASSSKNAKTVIKRIKIGNEFDAIVDGTMITNSKPDPEIFLLTASLLHTSPYECVVFEDAKAGVEAARNAGMRSVGVGSARQLGKANLVISRTGDFNVELLESL